MLTCFFGWQRFYYSIRWIIFKSKKGRQVFKLKGNDKLYKVCKCYNSEIAILNKSGKLLIFKLDTLPILNKGSGVQLMKIKDKDSISDIQIFNTDDGLIWQTGSKIRNLNKLNYWIGKRAQSGKKIPN